MGEKATKHMELESKLRRALDRSEFELYYQPQMDIKTGSTCCMEALIRWNSPEFGLLAPNHFIPLAEETGLIIPIGEWVLNAACVQCKDWQDKGLKNTRVAINVSRRQLETAHFLFSVTSALNRSGLDPHFLEIELTESAVMQQPNFAISIFKNLKKMGVTLSIDDFGTGYSSLADLKHFTIDRLKVDRSFVSDIEDSPDAKAIVTAIIAMGHILNLSVVAEGVETQRQMDLLKESGCDCMQGFLLSKPKPIKEIFTDYGIIEQAFDVPITPQQVTGSPLRANPV
jgi:EAL domain-containing protein (putative c-di-GMP-specific phosphodiesterase class I)